MSPIFPLGSSQSNLDIRSPYIATSRVVSGILDACASYGNQRSVRGDASVIGDTPLEFLQNVNTTETGKGKCWAAYSPMTELHAQRITDGSLAKKAMLYRNTMRAYRSDSVTSNMVCHESNPWSMKTLRY